MQKARLYYELEALEEVIARYNASTNSLNPSETHLMKRHLLDMERHILPGLTRVPWTALGIGEYIQDITKGLLSNVYKPFFPENWKAYEGKCYLVVFNGLLEKLLMRFFVRYIIRIKQRSKRVVGGVRLLAFSSSTRFDAMQLYYQRVLASKTSKSFARRRNSKRENGNTWMPY